MKKIIGLLVITMFSVTMFGQTSGVYGVFEEESQHLGMQRKIHKAGVTDISKWVQDYEFVANDKQYIVSYEPCESCGERIERGKTQYRAVNLYRWDLTQFNIAIDKPLRIDYYKRNENNIVSRDAYFPQDYGGSNGVVENSICSKENMGYIKKLENGVIEIKLTVYSSTDIYDHHSKTYYSETIYLIPDGENYIIKQ